MGETMLGACYGQGGTTTRNIMVHVSGMSQRLLNFWGLRGAILNQSMRRKEGAREGNLHILTRFQFLEIPLSPLVLSTAVIVAIELGERRLRL